ncbi:Major Facilitator Superfamily protein [Pseudarcicella hirudinis]|uniref:Major Facilitator Superfamily protein n=1 Tax=Pseudarcicella hirudinis TaxID=1079859 RepID=A0A1I5W1G3_9BACT|nr:MFS transporter [Pseudarcicella hirudinis]SFQ13604.1 Major Facilitator Superfamily protein [Pseudarcicella hirudinis]
MTETSISRNTKILIAVASLGYFVDVYDLILFGVVRNQSLASLGLSKEQQLSQGLNLLNIQMAGMLLGGIIWGIWGDKKGRKSVLFGSILLYSLANVANGFVHDLTTYAILRFLAGIGLAGELGAGITLVNESLPREKRGIGALFIAGVGALGAVTAAIIAGLSPDPEWWRISYFIGGAMGLALLVLRVGTFESVLFKNVKEDVSKGDFISLFTNTERFKKYIYCILIGLPVWCVVGILILAAPELSKALGITGEPILGNKTIMYTYIGLSIGDFLSGLISQLLRSRKKTVYIFVGICFFFIVCYLYLCNGVSSDIFYIICLMLGFFGGYWAVFVTMASEQFGTNLRATVTTTVPNFVRGALIPITIGFKALIPQIGIVNAAMVVGVVCCFSALWATTKLDETFTKDLDYLE